MPIIIQCSDEDFMVHLMGYSMIWGCFNLVRWHKLPCSPLWRVKLHQNRQRGSAVIQSDYPSLNASSTVDIKCCIACIQNLWLVYLNKSKGLFFFLFQLEILCWNSVNSLHVPHPLISAMCCCHSATISPHVQLGPEVFLK